MDASDRALLARVAAGEQRALEELYARHAHALLAYAEGLLGDRGRAEEALQDTFLAVWRGAAGFEGRSAVRTWLFGICRRQALSRLGRTEPQALEVPEDLAAATPGPEAITIARAEMAAVAAAFRQLPQPHRDVLHLAFAAGLPHRDIAEVLGIPEGTVKSRLFHARAAVSKALRSDQPQEAVQSDRPHRAVSADRSQRTSEPGQPPGAVRCRQRQAVRAAPRPAGRPVWERA